MKRASPQLHHARPRVVDAWSEDRAGLAPGQACPDWRRASMSLPPGASATLVRRSLPARRKPWP